MTLALTEKIERVTKTPYDKVVSIFSSAISQRFQFFPDQIMSGHIYNGKIKTVINPPTGWSDPFRSRVIGNIIIENDQTRIQLKISPNWLILGFLIIWNGLLLLMILKFDYTEFLKSIKFIGLNFIWAIIPIGLVKIKVNWDKRRLDKWLNKNINNSA
jgi:hypothetical protein